MSSDKELDDDFKDGEAICELAAEHLRRMGAEQLQRTVGEVEVTITVRRI